ncbi:MAG: pyrroline-5-carboxylate reductase [Propionibacteriaceae bacterium]|jgi:pyrroline-5-carboxylate reductase|nr:pyrroline-5-carboxylate reductase [Propionibacteriaceae bacterium]
MTTAILGLGVMGEVLLTGLLRSGWGAETIKVTARRPERQAEIAQRHSVTVCSNREAVAGADTVVVAVKPQDLADVLDEIADVLAPDALVVSLAAGVETATIESRLPVGAAVVRAMPNTPASVGQGMAAISAGSRAGDDHLRRVSDILSAVGRVVVVPERYQNAVTAISGSGPAYVMFVAEAMIDAGVMLGLPRGVATELVIQTVYGSAQLLRDSGQHPTVLRENVTSPGGTTTAALRAFETHRVKAAFMDAMEAACQRSQALGRARPEPS